MIRRIVGLYFSPLGGTASMIHKLAGDIANELQDCSPDDLRLECYDLLHMKDSAPQMDDETIAVIGMPVYVGKIPVPGMNAISMLNGNGAMAFTAVSYGSRTYGNALYELGHFAEAQGFKVVGAGAFAVKYGAGLRRRRPSGIHVDSSSLAEFGKAASAKIRRLTGCDVEGLKIKPAPLEVSGRLPVHRVSRISPKAAEIAQDILQRVCIIRRESEWYL